MYRDSETVGSTDREGPAVDGGGADGLGADAEDVFGGFRGGEEGLVVFGAEFAEAAFVFGLGGKEGLGRGEEKGRGVRKLGCNGRVVAA